MKRNILNNEIEKLPQTHSLLLLFSLRLHSCACVRVPALLRGSLRQGLEESSKMAAPPVRPQGPRSEGGCSREQSVGEELVT